VGIKPEDGGRRGRKLAKCALASVGQRKMRWNSGRPPRVPYKPELENDIEEEL
jgi:hypothetical protein